jgi:hypothetical protein
MTYKDLPDDWPTRSLDDAAIARDVIDLVVSDSDRSRAGIAVLLCNGSGRLVQPVIVHDATPAEDLREDLRVLRTVVLGETPHGHHGVLVPAVLLALIRPAGPVDDVDRAWHQRAIEVCGGKGVRLLGVHLVTRFRVWTLPGPGSAVRVA